MTLCGVTALPRSAATLKISNIFFVVTLNQEGYAERSVEICAEEAPSARD